MPNKKAIAKLKRHQHDAQAELKTRIKKAQVRIAKKIQGLRPEDYPIWDKKVREQFFNQVGSHYEVIGKELDAWGKELTGKVAADYHGAAITDIKNLSGSAAVKANTLRFSRQRVNRYWEIIHPDNAQHLAAVYTNKMAATDIQALRSAFVDTYRQRALESWTQAEYHKRLYSAWETIGGNLGSHKFVDAAGRPWANDRYISMLARTTTARVARDSYFDTLIQNGDDLARIGPSGDSCPVCRRWIGIIVSISGKNPNFPSYQQTLTAGMFHPNCDCLCSRIDETVHAADIERQKKTKNVDWNDPDAVDKYKANITKKKGAKPAKASLGDMKDKGKKSSPGDWDAFQKKAFPKVAPPLPKLDLTAAKKKAAAKAKAIQEAKEQAAKEAAELKAAQEAQEAAEAAAKAKALAEAKKAQEAAKAARLDDVLNAEDLETMGMGGADEFGTLLTKTNKTVGGSQGSIVMKDPTGQEWIVKSYRGDPDRVRSEWAANRLYDQLGVKVPTGRIGRVDGDLVFCSKRVDGVVEMRSKYVDFASETLTLRRGFVADSWLANWDVAGADWDNVLLTPGVKKSILRIDQGGSLKYRAMGELKGKDWGRVVQELESFRSGMNPQTAQLFQHVTDEDIRKAVLQLRKLAPKKDIRAILEATGWDDVTIDDLEKTLLARKKFLTERYLGKKAVKEKAQAQVTKAADASLSESLTNNEIAMIKDARQNGVTVRIDKADIEDQNVHFWMEVDAANRPVMAATFKAHGKALDKLDDLLGAKAAKLPDIDVGTLDNKIEETLKGIGRLELDLKTGSGDGLLRAKDLERAREVRAMFGDRMTTLRSLVADGKVAKTELTRFQKAFKPWVERVEAIVQKGEGTKASLAATKGEWFTKNAFGDLKLKPIKREPGKLTFRKEGLYETKTTDKGFPRVTGKGGMGSFDDEFPFYEADAGDGVIVRIWPGNGAYAQRGRVEIISQGQDLASAERIRKTMGDLGLDSVRARAGDMEELYLRQIAHNGTRHLSEFRDFERVVAAAGDAQADKIKAAQDWLNTYFKKDITKSPIYRPEGKLQHFGHGINVRERADLFGKDWDDFEKGYRLYHDLEYGGGNQLEKLDRILNSGGHMASTTDRLRRGIPPSADGGSPAPDMRSGGANFVFGRIRESATRTRGITWKATHFRRVDALRYPGDRYGRTKDGIEDIFTNRIPSLSDWRRSSGGGNETNFKNSISIFDELDFFGVRDAAEKKKALAVFKKHNWNATDPWPDGSGRTVDDVIQIVGGY